jgi:hypothetical protein
MGRPPIAAQGQQAWRVGAILVSVIVVAARLGLPQPIAPQTPPLPQLDQTRAVQEAQEHATLFAQAQSEALPHAVRAVGELLRRLGALEARLAAGARDVSEHDSVSRELTHSARRLYAAGRASELLRLRALQTQLFLRAAYEVAGREPADPLAVLQFPEQATELQQLGGSFIARLTHAGRVPVFAQDELAAAYRMRWSRLVGLQQQFAFAPSLNDVRLNARLRLRWAEQFAGPERRGIQMKAIGEVAEADSAYPAEFARGIAAYQAGAFAEAFEHFAQFRRIQPDGPWALRARNHAQAAATFLAERH